MTGGLRSDTSILNSASTSEPQVAYMRPCIGNECNSFVENCEDSSVEGNVPLHVIMPLVCRSDRQDYHRHISWKQYKGRGRLQKESGQWKGIHTEEQG
jgi:hypothetical protein